MKCLRHRPAATAHRRSPCGERGLKLNQRVIGSFRLLSLPVRGAWVEMTIHDIARKSVGVAPRAGSVG